MSSAAEADSPPQDHLAIQQVSDLLGVPAPTLRSWERRYGLPLTGRSGGGHRRYSPESLHELRLMRDEIARGRKASDAARHVRLLLDQGGPGRDWVSSLLDASASMDPRAVREVLDSAWVELGLDATVDTVLMPGMRQIGVWWQSGRCDIGQEHLTTEAARSWAARTTSLAAPPSYDATVLLACGPRDLHTLGLEALGALLAHRGVASRVLGARTPQRTLVTAAAATDASAVVVVSHLSTQRRPAVDAIRGVAESGRAVFYAGNAFLFPDGRDGVPGTYLGESLTCAADVVLASLGCEPAQP